MTTPRLSVSIIAKNEERFLSQALASLRNHVDEIIALGAVVHEEFNGKAIPVLVLDNESFERALAARFAQLKLDGTVVLHD